MRGFLKTTAAVAACLVITTIAYAVVTIDYTTGTGFAGKGDVQLACGFNNAAIQGWAGSFRAASQTVTVSEISWTCTNSNNQNEQIRERTTTVSSSVQGILSAVARVKNQVTGYHLNGYSGAPTITSSPPSTEGPPVNSCPSGPWSLTTPAGAPEVTSTSTSVVEVECVPGSGIWTPIN